jgi:hypothetical protein
MKKGGTQKSLLNTLIMCVSMVKRAKKAPTDRFLFSSVEEPVVAFRVLVSKGFSDSSSKFGAIDIAFKPFVDIARLHGFVQ